MTPTKIFFYLFLITIPLGTRFLVYQFTPTPKFLVWGFTSGFNEYASAFLYLSDIFLIFFLAFSYSNVLKNIRIRKNAVIVIFLLAALISILVAPSKGLALYNFIRLAFLVLLAFSVARILKGGLIKIDAILVILAGSAVFQSIIGFLQFAGQSSLGLKWLGESVLGPDIGGAAKIVVDGVKILRAYGTFPHPNVLAAFLLLGLFSLYYLWLKSSANNEFVTNKRIFFGFVNSQFIRYSLMSAVLFVIILGLALTFSRTAWVIAILLTILAGSYWLFESAHRKNALFLLLTLLISGVALVAIFSSYIFLRAQISPTEPAVSYRLAYNRIALDLIKDRPLGVGIGNQVLYSIKNEVYQKLGMDQPWQWQPIHNVYLLISVEVSIIGLIIFLVFISRLLISNFQFLISKQFPMTNDQKLEKAILVVMLSSLLLFGLFDHFLWTLQSGRLMLWLVIGILLGLRRAGFELVLDLVSQEGISSEAGGASCSKSYSSDD